MIQVSTDDSRTQKIALNNAVNIQKLYGMDNLTIEIIAYAPGLGLLTKKNPRLRGLQALQCRILLSVPA
jgi:intracellular sulfur oxidation DsrE/DsrF family protein